MIDFMLITRVRSPGLVCIRMDPRSYWSNPRSVLVKIMLAGGLANVSNQLCYLRASAATVWIQ